MPKRGRDERGGIRQRMAARAAGSADDALPPPDPERSHLAEHLLGQFFWGHLSAPEVQRLAEAAGKDFLQAGAPVPRDIGILSSLGQSGKYPGKINAQIRAKYTPGKMLAAPSKFNFPLLARPGRLVAHYAPCFVFLPHVVFSAIFRDFPLLFEKYICPSQDRLKEFWRTQRGNPQLTGHPITTSGADYRSTCVPLALHSDGVVMSGLGKRWAKASDVYSWRSLLGTGSTTDVSFLIWSVWTSIVSSLFGQHTKKAFWRVLCWSLEALQSGYWPKKDPYGVAYTHGPDYERAGTPLTGRGARFRRATLWVVSADLDFYRAEFGFPNSQNKAEPCAWCSASAEDTAPAGYHAFEFRPTHCLWKANPTSIAQWYRGYKNRRGGAGRGLSRCNATARHLRFARGANRRRSGRGNGNVRDSKGNGDGEGTWVTAEGMRRQRESHRDGKASARRLRFPIRSESTASVSRTQGLSLNIPRRELLPAPPNFDRQISKWNKHVIFQAVPGVSIWTAAPDYMHVVHLGIYQYAFGSTLALLCYKILPGVDTEPLCRELRLPHQRHTPCSSIDP